jgi:hypothetical protein
MINRQSNSIVFECDTCPETFRAGTDDFSDAWLMAKTEDWRSKKIGQEWMHFCGKCRS